MDTQSENNTELQLEPATEPVPEPVTEPVPVPQYEDPNANRKPENDTPVNQFEDNYNYNVNTSAGHQTSYEPHMDDKPMSMGDWLLTIVVMLLLPCVGIPMYFVWAFSKNGNINRRNYCRAYLIVTGISLIIGLIICVVVGVAMFSYLPYYY